MDPDRHALVPHAMLLIMCSCLLFMSCLFPYFSYLGLHLPHPVDHKNGKAQWDGKTETLSVTLRLKREYDFMNF